jgi:hypothetical protein
MCTASLLHGPHIVSFSGLTQFGDAECTIYTLQRIHFEFIGLDCLFSLRYISMLSKRPSVTPHQVNLMLMYYWKLIDTFEKFA